MSTITVRGLDETTKSRIRMRAASHGRSMEAEARAILRAAVTSPPSTGGLGSRIRSRFADLDGVELDIPARDEQARWVDFAE